MMIVYHYNQCVLSTVRHIQVSMVSVASVFFVLRKDVTAVHDLAASNQYFQLVISLLLPVGTSTQVSVLIIHRLYHII